MLKFEDITPEMINRFWSHVKIGKSDECWPWMISKFKDGYGQFSAKINNKWMNLRAHRISWMIYNKQNIPDGMVIMHICDNTFCCNPNCLQLSTIALNNKDKALKGRALKGKKFSKEHNIRISIARTGIKFTEEHKKNMSIVRIGKSNNWLGRKHSEESKAKIKKNHKGSTPESRLKISIALKAYWDAHKLKASQG